MSLSARNRRPKSRPFWIRTPSPGKIRQKRSPRLQVLYHHPITIHCLGPLKKIFRFLQLPKHLICNSSSDSETSERLCTLILLSAINWNVVLPRSAGVGRATTSRLPSTARLSTTRIQFTTTVPVRCPHSDQEKSAF